MMCVVVQSSGTQLLRSTLSSVSSQRDPALSTTAGISFTMLTLTKRSSTRYLADIHVVPSGLQVTCNVVVGSIVKIPFKLPQ